MQFSSWPDYGVPHSALAFLDFLHKIREIQNSNLGSLGDLWNGHSLGPPIVVHCSAGIGRTGSFFRYCVKSLFFLFLCISNNVHLLALVSTTLTDYFHLGTCR